MKVKAIISVVNFSVAIFRSDIITSMIKYARNLTQVCKTHNYSQRNLVKKRIL